jgi:hypothetical protein
MLRRTLLSFATLVVAIAAAGAVPAVAATRPSDDSDYTPAQIHKMVRQAHTVQQYTVLADYYQTRQRMFKRKAAEEMHLWAERNAVITPLSEKWPRPVDSARNLYDYYVAMENDSAAKVAHFNQLADAAPYQ